MTLTATTTATPFGAMTTISAADVLHVAAFRDDADSLRDRLPAELRGERIRRDRSAAGDALEAYFDGDLTALDSIEVQQPGGRFHSDVWREMRQVAPGTTVSYADLAARAGAPRAVRAAASACARNAICLFVPCHRVVRSDGSLGGYFYGLDVKRRLIEHESGHRVATDNAQAAAAG
jgi:methylated-DNA-[protein]-cysteine S-methyltransferase